MAAILLEAEMGEKAGNRFIHWSLSTASLILVFLSSNMPSVSQSRVSYLHFWRINQWTSFSVGEEPSSIPCGLEGCSSHFNMRAGHLRSSWTVGFDSVGLGWSLRFCLFNKCQVMLLLLVQGRTTLPIADPGLWCSNSFSPGPPCFSCILYPAVLEPPAAVSFEDSLVCTGFILSSAADDAEAQPFQVGWVTYHWPICSLASKTSLSSSLLFLLTFVSLCLFWNFFTLGGFREGQNIFLKFGDCIGAEPAYFMINNCCFKSLGLCARSVLHPSFHFSACQTLLQSSRLSSNDWLLWSPLPSRLFKPVCSHDFNS